MSRVVRRSAHSGELGEALGDGARAVTAAVHAPIVVLPFDTLMSMLSATISPGSVGTPLGPKDVRATSHALTFLPGDPPRLGAIVVYERSRATTAETAALPDEIEVALPNASGRGVRRITVAASRVPVADAIAFLRDLEVDVPGAQAWLEALTMGLGLIARGRLYPSITPSGWDTWRAGPLDPADRRLLAELAAAFPPEAYAVPLGRSSPMRLRSPGSLIQALWDALADTLPRTAAATLLTGLATRGAGHDIAQDEQAGADSTSPRAPFASFAPVHAAPLRPWLVDAAGGFVGERGADVALRIELDHLGRVPSVAALEQDDENDAGAAASDDERGDPSAPMARAVLQLTSRAESSLVVDAVDLYHSPAAVVARFGDDVETDLLRALRRAARAWAPLDRLLHERAPTGLDLDENLLAELLSDSATFLQGTGVEVLWPAEILADGIELRAAIVAAPGVVVEAGFGLDTLVEFRWQATLHGELLSEEEIDQLAEAKRGLVRLRGRWVAADPALLERLRARRNRRLTAAEALGALLAGTIDLDSEPVAVVGEGPLAELAGRLTAMTGASESELGIPPGLAGDVQLRPYQSRGVTWLHAMTDAGIGGCLADDMGLGKTLQVIALHLHRAAAGRGPTLVVCPTSLLGNWEREVRRFAPGTSVRRHHGSARSLADLPPGELVVTSYGVARRDAEALASAGFSLVVADEAQHAKNPESATARALRTIAGSGGPARLALTGTPVENRLSELWSIIDWTTPGLLGPFDRFVRTVATPIERDRDPLATERLARMIRPFVLRRKKTDPGVAPDLPPRTVTDVPVPLTSEQTTLYEAEVREALDAIRNKDGIARQGLVLRLLTVLKQICNHPAQYLHQAGPLAGRSGKLAALEELIDVIVAEGESVLVFSQFVECLSLVEARLEHLGVGTLFLHGKVGAKRRTEMVEAFQAGAAPVLLLSLKAGGVGLNLTRATHVVHYDRWWNPAVEDQATDRAHRIGQDRPVQVHRLIAEGTLEDRIAALIERKRSLAEAVVGAGESWIGRLTNEELADLVSLGSGA
ncbi:MAG: SNF2-related protein [Acidimicrobiaceae bacterium]|nr:SNF2-related protein [Acidimicrobiaceae bacterium]